jgi:hypothetical protein
MYNLRDFADAEGVEASMPETPILLFNVNTFDEMLEKVRILLRILNASYVDVSSRKA